MYSFGNYNPYFPAQKTEPEEEEEAESGGATKNKSLEPLISGRRITWALPPTSQQGSSCHSHALTHRQSHRAK